MMQRLNQPSAGFLAGLGLMVSIGTASSALSLSTTHLNGLTEQFKPQKIDQQPATITAIAQQDAEPISILRRKLKHPDWKIRKAAAIALGKLGLQAKSAIPDLTTVLRDKNPEVILAAIDALGNMGEAAAPAVPALIRHLTNPLFEDPTLPQRVESTLVKIGRPAIPALIELLDSGFDSAEFPAILALRNIGQPAIPLLIQALQSPKWIVRAGAASALMMGEQAKDATPSLIERLTSQQNGEQDGFVRSQIMETLGANHIEAQTVVPVLIKLLPNPVAVEALGQFGEEASRAVPDLAKLLHDRSRENESSRIATVEALLKIGQSSRSAISDLKYALTDPDYIVRYEAARTIVSLGVTQEFDAAIETVLELLKSPDDTERSYAIATLEEIGLVSIQQSVAELIKTIQTDPQSNIRDKATYALIKIARTLKDHQGNREVSSADIQAVAQGLEAAQRVWQAQKQELTRLYKPSLDKDEWFGLRSAQEMIDFRLQEIHNALQIVKLMSE
jgi:HEAT repeat protein